MSTEAATTLPGAESGAADAVVDAAGRKRLRLLLTAGIVDSTGLAFGWTVFLLAVTDRHGLDGAAVQASAMLVGVALSAPFSAWLAPRLSPQTVLRFLALTEGTCRLLLFVLLALDANGWALAPLVAVMNVLAWAGFAAMRSEAARAEDATSGRSLTWYAVAISASEALAAAAASVLVGSRPSPAILAAVGVVYVGALLPQWLAARSAERRRVPRYHARLPLRDVLPSCGLGALTFFLAGSPALLATVLAYDLYGTTGVVVSAVSFAVASLGATRVQSAVGDWRPAPTASFALGALLVGGWTLSGSHLAGLAVAQACAGVAQCSLEGDMDARVLTRLNLGGEMSGLAMASASRALGGALAVGLLPSLLTHVSLPTMASAAAGVLLAGAAASAVLPPWWRSRGACRRGDCRTVWSQSPPSGRALIPRPRAGSRPCCDILSGIWPTCDQLSSDRLPG